MPQAIECFLAELHTHASARRTRTHAPSATDQFVVVNNDEHRGSAPFENS